MPNIGKWRIFHISPASVLQGKSVFGSGSSYCDINIRNVTFYFSQIYSVCLVTIIDYVLDVKSFRRAKQGFVI